MQKLLLLEHDPATRELLRTAFQKAGYDVVAAADGVEGIALARHETPDLVLVNLMLPKINGYGVCGMIREDNDTPIIMLSSRYEEHYCITSFEMGANDFVTTPFSTAELIARVRALLRWHPLVRHAPSTTLRHRQPADGSLTVNRTSRQVWRNGAEVALTHQEFELLTYLMQHEDVVISRNELLSDVWKNAAMVQPRTVDVHIHMLRMKIEEDPARPHFIQTVRGAGYRFQIPSRTAPHSAVVQQASQPWVTIR